MDKQSLLQTYADNLSSSGGRNLYLKYARDFLESADALDRGAVERYLEGLRRRGRRPGTINFAFRVIRRLYAVNGLPWEFRRGEAPAIGERDEHRPQLSSDIIRLTIAAATDGKLESDEGCFLALSTTYGLRREEMTGLKPGDVDLSNSAIYVCTVKQGRQRYHLIPVEIKPYLERHDFSKTYSPVGMSQVFWRILNRCGLGGLKPERLGWHSIRRSLLNGLVNNGVNPFAARAFMRWKGTMGELAMPARYYGNVVVTLDGAKPVLEEAKGDEEIFEKHPFLPMWRGEDGL